MESKYTKGLIEFIPLSKISVASSKNYSFYAVVLDATAGYKKYENWILSMKIIDPSCYYSNNDETESTDSSVTPHKNKSSQSKANMTTNSSYWSVTLFSKNCNQLPKIRKVGDIVRILNATVIWIICSKVITDMNNQSWSFIINTNLLFIAK